MILVTGSLAYDLIMNFPGRFSDHILPEKIHDLNLSFLVKDLRRERGGCSANIAYNLALLGMKPAILGVLGRDGGEYKKWLSARGVDVSRIKTSGKLTSRAHIMTDQADNQITSFYPGPMKENAKLKIQSASWRTKFVVIAPNEPQAMINFALECQQLKLPYLFDPGMQLPRLTKRQLEQGISGAKIVIGNDYEMSLITAKGTLREWPNGLSRSEGIGSDSEVGRQDQIWITTLGAKGSIIKYQGKTIKIKPAKPKNTSDPTGAGDAYRAGFLVGWLRGFDLETCGQMASLCAAYTVEKYGTTTHSFTKKQFAKRYRENYNKKLVL